MEPTGLFLFKVGSYNNFSRISWY